METDYANQHTLLAEIKEGRHEAFEFLFKNYYPRLNAYASRFINDAEAVKDILQECFIKIWEKKEELKNISIQSLLFAMVRNACLNHLKHGKIVEQHQIEYLADIAGEERLYYADFDFEADRPLLYRELEEQIRHVIDNLPARCREVFLLSRFKGLKNGEIAERLHISVSAVENHITKALSKFSQHFRNKYPLDIYIAIIAWLIVD
jgi:RNA polymerase sigma-70 factor (ECF subfamily)